MDHCPPHPTPVVARMHMFLDFSEPSDGTEGKKRKVSSKTGRSLTESELLASLRLAQSSGEFGRYISPMIALVYGLRCTSDALEALYSTLSAVSKVFKLLCPSFMKCQSYKIELIVIPFVVAVLQCYKLILNASKNNEIVQTQLSNFMKKGNNLFIFFNMACACFFLLQKLKRN